MNIQQRFLIWNYACTTSTMGFLSGSGGKESTCSEETRVGSLGQGDPQEKEMATHSSILAWKTPWTEEPGGLQSTGFQESDTP